MKRPSKTSYAVKEELARAENFDYKIVNDDLDKQISELDVL